MQPSATSTQVHAITSVVCLDGAEQFNEALLAASQWLANEGHIVLNLRESGNTLPPEHVNVQKIALCDELIVLNLGGYIDDNSRRHIICAQRAGKSITFFENTNWNAPISGIRRSPRQHTPQLLHNDETTELEEGAVIDLTQAFRVESGAVLLYGSNETRPAFTLVRNHVWPGVEWVPEVWYAEAASNTCVARVNADQTTLQPLGEIIRWAVATSGQVCERMLWALLTLGSVSTQDELSAVIGCRRESVTSAMRSLRDQGLVEKHEGRLRLTSRGVVCATQLCSLDRDDDLNVEENQEDDTMDGLVIEAQRWDA